MPSFRELTAAQAAHIRDLLRHKKVRDIEGTFVLEGSKPIQEMLGKGEPALQSIVVTHPFLERCDPTLGKLLAARHHLVHTCRTTVFDALAHQTSPAGILAIARKPVWNESSILSRPVLWGIFAENVQDPANVGGLIRTAAAFGVDAVWLSSDSADPFNPKVVRGTAGTIFRIPVLQTSRSGLFQNHGCTVMASQPHGRGSVPMHSIEARPSKTIVAFGNEGRGLSPALLKQAAQRFHIPVKRGVESLNIAASVAIAMYHFSTCRLQESEEENGGL